MGRFSSGRIRPSSGDSPRYAYHARYGGDDALPDRGGRGSPRQDHGEFRCPRAKAFLFRNVRTLLAKNGFSLIQNYGAWYGLPVDFFGTVLFSGLLKRLSGGGSVGFPGFLIFEAEKVDNTAICKPARTFKKAPAKPVASGAITE